MYTKSPVFPVSHRDSARVVVIVTFERCQCDIVDSTIFLPAWRRYHPHRPMIGRSLPTSQGLFKVFSCSQVELPHLGRSVDKHQRCPIAANRIHEVCQDLMFRSHSAKILSDMVLMPRRYLMQGQAVARNSAPHSCLHFFSQVQLRCQFYTYVL